MAHRVGVSLSLLAALTFALILTTSAVSETRRDSAALQLIATMGAACGWNSTPPATVVATGTVTIQGKSEPVILEAKPGWLRIDTPESKVVMVVHDTIGTKFADGKPLALNGSEAASIQSLMFPFYTELASVADPTLSVRHGGTDQVSDAPVQVVNLASKKHQDGLDSLRHAASKLSVAISNDKSLPLRIRFYRMSRETQHAGVDTDAYLGDFRSIGGVLVPFQYEERVGSQSLFVFQFDKVVFNSPIPNSDFNLY
jgi:hypothetical protein